MGEHRAELEEGVGEEPVAAILHVAALGEEATLLQLEEAIDVCSADHRRSP